MNSINSGHFVWPTSTSSSGNEVSDRCPVYKYAWYNFAGEDLPHMSPSFISPQTTYRTGDVKRCILRSKKTIERAASVTRCITPSGHSDGITHSTEMK